MRVALILAALAWPAWASPIIITGTIGTDGADVTGVGLAMMGSNYWDFQHEVYGQPLPPLTTGLVYDTFSSNGGVFIQDQGGQIGELSLHSYAGEWVGTYSIYAPTDWPGNFRWVTSQDVETQVHEIFGIAPDGRQGVTGYSLTTPLSTPEPETGWLLAFGVVLGGILYTPCRTMNS